MSGGAINRQVRLRERPAGAIDDSTFELAESERPSIGPGQALARNLFVSIDPTNRMWISETPTYLPPVEIGAVMRAGGIGRIVESNNDAYPVGDLVTGMTGWQDYTVVAADSVPAFMRIPAAMQAPPALLMGVLGHTGLTAWYGIEEIGKPTEGETVVVSAAAGAVGTIAGQLAKLRGARVVGIAGGEDKCRWLVDELGFDAAIDRHAPDWRQQLRAACPDGVDVDFENVGGEIMDAVFSMLNLHSRVALCGLISQYNATEPPPGPRSFGVLLTNRVLVQGFIILDFLPHAMEAVGKLAQLVMEGKLQHRDTVVDGLENAPDALNRLFTGDHTGKLLVKVADDPGPPGGGTG